MRQLYTLAAIVPALAMIAAHYMPWGPLLGRPLPRIAAYALGTLAIVGTSGSLLATTEAQVAPRQSARVVMVASGSAGVATILAWVLDWALAEHNQRLDDQIRRSRS